MVTAEISVAAVVAVAADTVVVEAAAVAAVVEVIKEIAEEVTEADAVVAEGEEVSIETLVKLLRVETKESESQLKVDR